MARDEPRIHRPSQNEGSRVKWHPPTNSCSEPFNHDPSVIKDAVLTAFRKRLVKLVSVPHPPIACSRNKDLEDRLKRRYHRVTSVTVMETSQIGFEGPQLDDEIHHVLGHEVAKIIADGWLFRSGDVIGVGAGRGVYYTVDSLSVMEPLFCEQIKIVSLTGSVEAKDHMAIVADHMDADLHAVNLMRCFSGATGQFIASKITPADMHQTSLSPAKWNEFHPNQALVGVGVLAPGHRFFEEVASQHPNPNSVLAPLRDDLGTLVECCKNIEKHVEVENYCACGDFCHQLFFINPPNNKAVAKGLRDNIDRLISQINSMTLTAGAAQLQSIDNIIVVAGTARKAFALMELLDSGKYGIHYLCTDSSAARAMLNTQHTSFS